MNKIINKQITAFVITYNEESNIENCLKSINWVNEIIVVDSFSHDRTVQIAKKYTNKIFFKKFKNDFAEQKNFAMQKISSKSTWILSLDADESLSPRAREKILRLIGVNKIDGYWIPRRNYINRDKYLKYGLFYPDYQLKLFKNDEKIKFIGQVHEEPNIPINRVKYVDDFEIYHNCSHTKYDSFISFQKLLPYIDIESNKIVQNKSKKIALIIKGLKDIFYYFFSSFIRGKGYKDGYYGFRAALIFSFYRGMVSFTAAKKLFTRNAN